jgi:hypothetical protein
MDTAHQFRASVTQQSGGGDARNACIVTASLALAFAHLVGGGRHGK